MSSSYNTKYIMGFNDNDTDDSIMLNSTQSILMGTSILFNLILVLCVCVQCVWCGNFINKCQQQPQEQLSKPVCHSVEIQTDPWTTKSVVVISPNGTDIEYGYYGDHGCF